MLRPFDANCRLSEWKKILGIVEDCRSPNFETVSKLDVARNTKTRVISQDVLRTRADEELYRLPQVRSLLRISLTRFCSYHRIEYMQGLNEILAPVLSLDPNTVQLELSKATATLSYNTTDATADEEIINGHPFGVHLAVFEALVSRLSPTTFSTRGVDAIQVQLTAFHILLMYHEPSLAILLRKEGMTPDIYAMSWLITLFARRQPVERALHIWDLMLQLDAPYIGVYLAVALLRSRKVSILERSADLLPETLVGLKFESDEEVDAVFQDALHLVANTPSNVTAELNTLGFTTTTTEAVREKGLKELWHRPCLEVGAEEVARSLSRQPRPHQKGALLSPLAPLRYLVLDCRHSVEKQLVDALYIEGSLTIPQAVQEEIVNLARQKSRLLGGDEAGVGVGNHSAESGGMDIERAFSRLIGQLSTRAASVLALLWSAFVTHCHDETVHFVIADDSTGPYQCEEVSRSEPPLNTCYALPYHTACSSENLPLRERSPSEHIENLPQYLRNSAMIASNMHTVSFASALIILGFPRVSIVKSEDLHQARALSNENAQFSCTDGNSFSSLPAMKTELLSSGFVCLVHHLGVCGVTPVVINAKYSHLQTPIDHFKEYQVCAFLHELRCATATYGVVHHDFYAGNHESQQELRTSSADSTPLRPSRPSTVGLTSPAAAGSTGASAGEATSVRKITSSSALAALSSALSAITPGSSPRKSSRTHVSAPAPASVSDQNMGSTAADNNDHQAQRPMGLRRAMPDSEGASLMRAKANCTLGILHELLLITSAQKKHHIIRLISTALFHSCVPAMRAYTAEGLEDWEAGGLRPGDYTYLLGPAPTTDMASSDAAYYAKLVALFSLRDTLQELVSTQRLNTLVDKTSNKANTKIRLLKGSTDQSAKHATRAITNLKKKTTLRWTQQRLAAENAATREGTAGSSGSGGSTEENSPFWKTTKDLTMFFSDEEGLTDSRSTSVMRDSLSVDHWDPSVVTRGRLDSTDSVGLTVSDIL